MKTVKIDSDHKDVIINCPNCDNWESLGIDDPRKRLHVIPIVEWLPLAANDNEISLNECTECKEKFKVEWIYE